MNWTANLVPLAPFVMIVFVVWFASMRQRAQDRTGQKYRKICSLSSRRPRNWQSL